MSRMQRFVTCAVALLIPAILATADTNLAITSFRDGMLTWTNLDANLYYTVQWRPALTGTNDWAGSYRACQDLRSTNQTITVPVPVFYRIVSTMNPDYPVAPVARTGQTPTIPLNPAPKGTDGDKHKGVSWPNPRFTDNANGTVTDNLTGLIWLKDANAFEGRAWTNALADCNTLSNGVHGLTDGSVAGDWRLPNVKELYSLITWQFYDPPLPNTAGTGQWSDGDPFTDVQSDIYWSSTPVADPSGDVWHVWLYVGRVGNDAQASTFYVWPVRGGQ